MAGGRHWRMHPAPSGRWNAGRSDGHVSASPICQSTERGTEMGQRRAGPNVLDLLHGLPMGVAEVRSRPAWSPQPPAPSGTVDTIGSRRRLNLPRRLRVAQPDPTAYADSLLGRFLQRQRLATALESTVHCTRAVLVRHADFLALLDDLEFEAAIATNVNLAQPHVVTARHIPCLPFDTLRFRAFTRLSSRESTGGF